MTAKESTDTIKIMLTGEGVTDYGWWDYAASQWREGAAAKLIRSCAEKYGVRISFCFADRSEVNQLRLQGHIQGLKGKAIPAKRFQTYLKDRECHIGIFYCDADRESGAKNNEHQAKLRFRQIHDEIQSVTAGDSTCTEIVIPMIALRMIESWLLSDVQAFEEVFGKQEVRKQNLSLPAKPEFLWGRESDPNSDYPKNLFVRICKKLNHDHAPDKEAYAEIAENTDIDVLCRKCPISFRQFFNDFNSILSTYGQKR